MTEAIGLYMIIAGIAYGLGWLTSGAMVRFANYLASRRETSDVSEIPEGPNKRTEIRVHCAEMGQHPGDSHQFDGNLHICQELNRHDGPHRCFCGLRYDGKFDIAKVSGESFLCIPIERAIIARPWVAEERGLKK